MKLLLKSILVLACVCPSLQAGVTITTLDGLTRVQPADSIIGGNSVAIKAARNEYEPFQIVVWADSGGATDVDMSISDFEDGQGNEIAATNVVFFREHFIYVTNSSPLSVYSPRWWPDALIPFEGTTNGPQVQYEAAPFDVTANTCQPVWVDVFVPAGTVPGNYTATVTVTEDGVTAGTIPVRLLVWNFELPDTASMRSLWPINETSLKNYYNILLDSAEFRALIDKYVSVLAEHRLNPQLPSHMYPTVNADGSLVLPNPYESSLTNFLAQKRPTGITIPIYGIPAKDTNFWPNIYNYFEARGFTNLFIYLSDEPGTLAAYDYIRTNAAAIHSSEPRMKVLVTEQPTPQNGAWGTLVGSVDIWVPLWGLFETNSANARLNAGEEVWSYTANTQVYGGQQSPYWEIDYPLLNYRIPAWINWRFGLNGLLYWRANFWTAVGTNSWINPATFVSGGDTFNGEGSVLYPGIQAGVYGPATSMRLKQLREGAEDYEYLMLLQRSGRSQLASPIVYQIARTWSDWNTPHSDLFASRDELGNLLGGLAGTISTSVLNVGTLNIIQQ